MPMRRAICTRWMSVVPPGWTEWDATGNGYGEFNYDFNENGRVVH